MTTSFIESPQALDALIVRLRNHALPFTVDVTKGKKRSVEQNRLQRELLRQVAEQLDDRTAEEWRGYAKLTIGVPILREENPAFREAYDDIIRPLAYEQKLRMMMEPLDWSVTRLMTTKQFTRYIEELERHFAEQGVVFKEKDRRL